MAREDRDRHFEKALARNLRSDRSDDARAPACPDAELLAAYHERSLPTEQMISWKEHIAGCSHCQELLAHLEATDEISLDAHREEYKEHEVPVASRPDPTVLTPVGALASAPAPAPTFAAGKSPERRRMLRRPANWRWLAPAGAIAAGLILWVAFHENRSDRFEMAKNQPVVAVPSAPQVSRSRQSETAEPNAEPKQAPKQEQATHSFSPALSQPGSASPEKKPIADENSRAALKQEATGAPIDKTKADRSRDQVAENSLPLSGRNASALQELSPDRFDSRKDPGDLGKQGGVGGGAAPQAAPPPISRAAGAALNSPARAVSTAAAPSGSAKKTPPPAPPAATESFKATNQNETVVLQSESQGVALDGVSSPGTNADMLRLARNQLPVTITTPNQKVLWRIEPAGIAQRSTDAGSIWTLQKTGVVADLTAGSAPSEKVCWIVGRAGTILRTTDGGAHWQQVRSPVTDDLSAVFAVDAQQATVSTTAGHKTYKTSDGGQTWTPLSNP